MYDWQGSDRVFSCTARPNMFEIKTLQEAPVSFVHIQACRLAHDRAGGMRLPSPRHTPERPGTEYCVGMLSTATTTALNVDFILIQL